VTRFRTETSRKSAEEHAKERGGANNDRLAYLGTRLGSIEAKLAYAVFPYHREMATRRRGGTYPKKRAVTAKWIREVIGKFTPPARYEGNFVEKSAANETREEEKGSLSEERGGYAGSNVGGAWKSSKLLLGDRAPKLLLKKKKKGTQDEYVAKQEQKVSQQRRRDEKKDRNFFAKKALLVSLTEKKPPSFVRKLSPRVEGGGAPEWLLAHVFNRLERGLRKGKHEEGGGGQNRGEDRRKPVEARVQGERTSA